MVSSTVYKKQTPSLPGLNCGSCGYKTCDEFSVVIESKPDLLKRCIHISRSSVGNSRTSQPLTSPVPKSSCSACAGRHTDACTSINSSAKFVDSLGRDFDFYLEHFSEDPGPREVVIPHNPMITRELNITPGDILIGRPLGMSCGCPVTHCGVVVE